MPENVYVKEIPSDPDLLPQLEDFIMGLAMSSFRKDPVRGVTQA